MSTAPSSVSLIVEHIVGYLSKRDESTPSPLFVALQGPQGSGKTYLTERVAASLSPYRVATLSIDDLYLPHSQLLELAISHPSNALLHGRGQPGTHDVPLGLSILHALKNINTSPSMSVRIPFFDKSLFGGEGDRVPESQWKSVSGPLDVVLLEGWCVGFYPQPRADVERRIGVPPLGLQDTFDMSRYALAHVLEVNARLAEYAQWWALFDVFVQIAPEDTHPYVHIYKWRLQQEHAMKAKNGGQGMSDDQVRAFVDRYIPGYHFFGAGVMEGGVDPLTGEQLRPPWLSAGGGRLLRVVIDENRAVIRTIKV